MSGVPSTESRLPLIVYILYLVGAAIGLTTVIGVIVAHLKRDEGPAWHRGHYVYQIRTFWIGLLYSLIGGLLAPFGIGVAILLAAAIWYLVRTIKGLLRFNDRRAIEAPLTWLV